MYAVDFPLARRGQSFFCIKYKQVPQRTAERVGQASSSSAFQLKRHFAYACLLSTACTTMKGKLILITGVSGFVGFAVLKYALEQGFQVRAPVRSEAKADFVRSTVGGLAKEGQLSFVVLPDILAPNALDEAVEGVTYVIHCASPVPFNEPTTNSAEDAYIKPAVNGTLGMLQSAAKAKSVTRVVITSSLIALVPIEATTKDTGVTYSADSRQPEHKGSFGPGTPTFAAYGASKVSALNQGEAWMKANKPHFDLIHIMPSFVLGKSDLWNSLSGLMTSSNVFPLVALGIAEAPPGGLPPTPATVVHIDDVARIHVQALEPKIKGGQSFLLNCPKKPLYWNDARAVAEKHFSSAVEAGTFLVAGGLGSINASLDVGKTEQTFGIERTYEDAVVSVAEQYLALREKGAAVNGGN